MSITRSSPSARAASAASSCWRFAATSPRAPARKAWSKARTTSASRTRMPVETGKNIEVHRVLLLRLPALRRARAAAADLAQEQAGGRDVPPHPGDVPAALGKPRARPTTRSKRSARSRSSRPRSSSRSTARARRCGTRRTSSTGRRPRALDRKKVGGALQLVRGRGQGQPREAARAAPTTSSRCRRSSSTASSRPAPRSCRGGHAAMPAAIDALVQKARAERPKS